MLIRSIAPHFYAIALFNKERAPGTEEFDLCNPASNGSKVKDAKLSPAMAERFQRAEGAQNNGFITLGLFAAAIVSAARGGLKLWSDVCAATLIAGRR
jgi:uncharacterized MAPEG superfamily protein